MEYISLSTRHEFCHRRVRTQPGGRTSLSNLWDEGDATEEFKPTRRYIHLCSAHDRKVHCNRVREGPGGEDHINNVSFSLVNKKMQQESTTLADILKNVVQFVFS